MKKKIVGMLIIILLTISYIPIIRSEESQAPESHKGEDGIIKFFFTGMVNGIEEHLSNGSFLLKLFGIYKNMDLTLEIGKNSFL